MLVSGMIIGTLFTLFVVPSIYVLVARSHATVPVEDDQRIAHGRELAGVAS
jgi:multidrug efflux pump